MLARKSERAWIVSARRAELPESHANTPFVTETPTYKRVERRAIPKGSLPFVVIRCLFGMLFLPRTHRSLAMLCLHVGHLFLWMMKRTLVGYFHETLGIKKYPFINPLSKGWNGELLFLISFLRFSRDWRTGEPPVAITFN
jgi:hypothetical protein